MSTEEKFCSFTATDSLLRPQGNRRRANICLSCVSSIIICFHLFHVDLGRNDQWEGCVGSLRCKRHRTVIEPELIHHRTNKYILMGNYLCLNHHIPTYLMLISLISIREGNTKSKTFHRYLWSGMFQQIVAVIRFEYFLFAKIWILNYFLE